MEGNRVPNYSIDAPTVVRNLLIVAALGVISLLTLLLGVWSKQDLIAGIAWPLLWAGLGSLPTARHRCGASGSMRRNSTTAAPPR